MRRHKILTGILLILSIIKLTLAAPAAGQWDWGSPNVPEPDHAPPPSPDPTDLLSQILNIPWSQIAQITEQLAGQHRHADRPPPPPDIPGLLTGSRLPVAGSLSPPLPPPPHPSQPGPSEDRSSGPQGSPVKAYSFSSINNYHVPPNPGWPTGLRLPMGSMPVAGSGPPPLSPPPHPRPSEDYFPGPPGFPERTYTLFSSTGNHYVPPSPGWPTGSRLPVGSMPMVGSLSPPPPPPPHLSQPEPSEDRSPGLLGFSAEPDTPSSTGSNETPPQSPGLDSEMHSLLNPEPFPSELEFWDKVLEGKIKRRMSGFDL
ncbi:hypothetical protein BGY98DRAFT_1095108 [Russula aff. rugulosa BPL654]|nr:hypothetical protein BGY98DRAFT_1095108 [Russula aff. rugulosa BPL654]